MIIWTSLQIEQVLSITYKQLSNDLNDFSVGLENNNKLFLIKKKINGCAEASIRIDGDDDLVSLHIGDMVDTGGVFYISDLFFRHRKIKKHIKNIRRLVKLRISPNTDRLINEAFPEIIANRFEEAFLGKK